MAGAVSITYVCDDTDAMIKLGSGSAPGASHRTCMTWSMGKLSGKCGGQVWTEASMLPGNVWVVLFILQSAKDPDDITLIATKGPKPKNTRQCLATYAVLKIPDIKASREGACPYSRKRFGEMQALAIKRSEAIQGHMPQTRKRKTVQVEQSPDHETSADAAATTPMPIKPAKKKSKSSKKGGSAKKTPKANIDAAKELQWHCTVAGCGQTFTNATGLSNHVRAKHKTITPAKTNAKEPKKKTGPKAKVDCLKLFIDPLLSPTLS